MPLAKQLDPEPAHPEPTEEARQVAQEYVDDERVIIREPPHFSVQERDLLKMLALRRRASTFVFTGLVKAR